MKTPHLDEALDKIGRKMAKLWASRVGKRTGELRRAIKDPRNIVRTPRTVTVGDFARKEVPHFEFVEKGHRAFHLPKRIKSWDISQKGTLYKRVAFKPKGSRREIIRTITPRSRGWHIPAMPGKHNVVEVPRLMRAEIKNILTKAAKRDGKEAIKSELKRIGKFALKVKI